MYPNLFDLGPLTVHTYGFLMALGFLFGLRIAVHYGRLEKIDSAVITDLVIYIFISALIGAKLLLLIVEFNYYAQDWHRLASILQVGGVYYGGFILALIVSIWFIRRRKMNFRQTADVLVMGLSFGQIFGRTGCFFAGCCWGKEAPAEFPLAITFTKPEAAEQVGTPLHVPLHPTQLYEALPLILIFLILALSFRRRKFVGQQLFLYLLLYSTLRFTVEFFRGDSRGFVGPFSTSQVISLVAFCGALVVFFTRKAHGRPAVKSGE